MNINIIIDGIKDERTFREMIVELQKLKNKNKLFNKVGVRWMKDVHKSDTGWNRNDRTYNPISDYVDMNNYDADTRIRLNQTAFDEYDYSIEEENKTKRTYNKKK